jgi:hypothetical protein
MVENKEGDNEQLMKLALITLHILLENCPNSMYENLSQITDVRIVL